MDFLWVRWFSLDDAFEAGWKAKHLPRIGFIDGSEECAFGFVDPTCVVRAVHLIPAFHLGRTTEIMGPSISRLPLENDEDYWRYYVGLFVIF
jgi:hypothetical protein